MSTLGDLFPEPMRKSLAEQNLGIGSVIRTTVPFSKPPKIKRFIVVGYDNSKVIFAAVLINSSINPRMFPTPEAKALHHELDPDGRPYLDNTSFVDCSEIFSCAKEDFVQLLTHDPACHIGCLSEGDLNEVTNKVRTAPTISVSDKRKFGFA